MTSPTAIWLDCDTGHDDAFAILLAACHPDVRLLGISTIYGNAPLSKTTYNTRAILKAIGREDIPVFVGVSKPFCRDSVSAPDIHGESGLDGTTCLPIPTVEARTDTAALNAMYQALSLTPKGTAWVVLTGPLTNGALLFATHPGLADHIAGLSIMGGAIGGGFTNAPLGALHGEGERFGNMTPWAEFNIWCDPESARSLLLNPVLAGKTTLVTLDLTHQFLATETVQNMMLHGYSGVVSESRIEKPSTVRKLFVEILTFFAKTYADVFGLVEGPPLHDPLAIAATFAQSLFYDGDRERLKVEVITDGEHGSSEHARSGSSQCGRTIATEIPSGAPGVRILRGLDSEAMWRMLDACLARAEQVRTEA